MPEKKYRALVMMWFEDVGSRQRTDMSEVTVSRDELMFLRASEGGH